eukprot:6386352-Amphidinium_carterae.1
MEHTMALPMISSLWSYPEPRIKEVLSSMRRVAPKFIVAFAQHLKRQGRFEIPKWADVVKTGVHKDT